MYSEEQNRAMELESQVADLEDERDRLLQQLDEANGIIDDLRASAKSAREYILVAASDIESTLNRALGELG